MAAPVEPPELAALLEASERARVGDWSLRSALCRYAQPHPARVRDVLELVRRIEAALHPAAKRLDRDGVRLWTVLDASGPPGAEDASLVGVLRALRELDQLGDDLAAWAMDRAGHDPGVAVGSTIASVTRQLDELGVAREDRERPHPGMRRRG